jgi:hypothetical protein
MEPVKGFQWPVIDVGSVAKLLLQESINPPGFIVAVSYFCVASARNGCWNKLPIWPDNVPLRIY